MDIPNESRAVSRDARGAEPGLQASVGAREDARATTPQDATKHRAISDAHAQQIVRSVLEVYAHVLIVDGPPGRPMRVMPGAKYTLPFGATGLPPGGSIVCGPCRIVIDGTAQSVQATESDVPEPQGPVLEFAKHDEPYVLVNNAGYVAGLTNLILFDVANLTAGMRTRLEDFRGKVGVDPIAAVITETKTVLVYNADLLYAAGVEGDPADPVRYGVGVLSIPGLAAYDVAEWQAIVDTTVVSLGGSDLVDGYPNPVRAAAALVFDSTPGAVDPANVTNATIPDGWNVKADADSLALEVALSRLDPFEKSLVASRCSPFVQVSATCTGAQSAADFLLANRLVLRTPPVVDLNVPQTVNVDAVRAFAIYPSGRIQEQYGCVRNHRDLGNRLQLLVAWDDAGFLFDPDADLPAIAIGMSAPTVWIVGVTDDAVRSIGENRR